MELQQQGMPGYGLYRSHYENPNASFPGNRGHLGGYPFPPMPGQNYSGYPHLGYPSSQSPGPREGKRKSMFLFLTNLGRFLNSPRCIEIQTGIKATYILKCRLFAITPILSIIHSAGSLRLLHYYDYDMHLGLRTVQGISGGSLIFLVLMRTNTKLV